MPRDNWFWKGYGPFQEDGDTWVPPGDAAEQLGWDAQEIARARKEGLELLKKAVPCTECHGTAVEPGGKCPSCRHQRPLFPGGKLLCRKRVIRGRNTFFPSQKCIDEIKQCREAIKHAGPAEGEITLEEALALAVKHKKAAVGNRKTLRALVDGISREALGPDKDGSPCKRVYVQEAPLLERLLAREDVVPDDRMTVKQFAEFVGVNKLTAYDWCATGKTPYGPLEVITTGVEIVTPQGPRPGFHVVSRSAKDILAVMDRDITKSFTDDDGNKWVPEPMALELYDTTKRILRFRALKRRVRYQDITYYDRQDRRKGLMRFYLDGPVSKEGTLGRCFAKTRPPVAANGTAEGNGRRESITQAGDNHHKPAREKHLKWKRWKDEGASYNDIVKRHQRETGERVTRDAVIQALRRL